MGESACKSRQGEADWSMNKVKRFGRRLGAAVFWGLVALGHGWVLAALYFWFSSHAGAAWAVVALYLAAVGLLFKVARRGADGAAVSLVLALVVGVWWAQRRPEAGLHYERESEQAAKLVVDGESLVVQGIRDFRRRRSGDWEPRWASRTFDLPQLQHVDFIFSSEADGAPVLASFVFGDQPPLAVTVEGRAEVGEPRTEARGYFRQYELGYVWADERDAVRRLASAARGPLYLHRSTLSPEKGRQLLAKLAERSNALEERPEFYNTLTDRGSAALGGLVAEVVGAARPWYGCLPWMGDGVGLACREGWLDLGPTGEAARAAAEIGERAREGAEDPDFSRRIRTHLAAPVSPEVEAAP